jgi:hypothetical protein
MYVVTMGENYVKLVNFLFFFEDFYIVWIIFYLILLFNSI